MPTTGSSEATDSPIQSRAGLWPAWIALICSLALTLVAWRYTQQEAELRLRLEFATETSRVRADLNTRIAGYTQTLRGAAALFTASDKVTRKEWRDYIAGLKLEQGYPAMQAVAFARSVAERELPALTTEMRASGVPDFAMRPPGVRERYVVNVYSEPYVGLNVKALGYDMWQDADRRETMQRAHDTGQPMITRRITLKVDEQGNPVPAFIMYFPVVRKPGAEAYGYVLSPFRMPVLMEDLLKRNSSNLWLSIHDGTEAKPETLFYRSTDEDRQVAARYSNSEPFVIGGRTWTLTYASQPEFEARADTSRSMQVLAGGLLTSMLLFAVAWSLATTRDRALRLARAMTVSLRESEARFRVLVEQAPDAITVYDVDLEHFVEVNVQAEKLYGCSREELLKSGPERFYPPGKFEGKSIADSVKELLDRALAGEQVHVERTIRNAQGKILRCDLRLARLPSADRRLIRGSFIDISERKQAEKALAREHAAQRDSEERIRLLLNSTGEGIYGIDLEGRCTFCNPAGLRMLGWGSHEDLLGRDMHATTHYQKPDGSPYPAHECPIYRVIETGEELWVDDEVFFRADGRSFTAHYGAHPMRHDGKIVGAVVTFTDVTERRLMEQELREGEERYRTLIEWTLEPVAVHSDGKLVYANPAALKMIGAKSETELIGKSPLELIHPDFHAVVIERMKTTAATGISMPMIEEKFLTLNGRTLDVEVRNTLVTYQGKPAVQVSMRDVTERNVAERQLRIAAITFECQEGMMVTGADQVILRVNQAFSEITGYSAEEAVGRTPRLLRSGRHDAAFYAAIWDSVNATGKWRGELWNRRKSGDVYPEWLSITAVRENDGVVTHYVGTFADITRRKAAEDEIKHLAFYDPLTRLPNRRLMFDRLNQALTSSARRERHGALMLFDLDDFKTLNDTLGHDVGDQFLMIVASRMESCIREGDTVARLGGDEFVVILEDLDAEATAAMQAESVAVKIQLALNQPCLLDLSLAGGEDETRSYHCTSSIGITLFRDQSVSVEELMKRADTAMYQAKAAGRNTLRFFDPDMQAVVTARAAMNADLRAAVREHQFLLYYQPQVDGEGRVTGAEALVRWQHPLRGLVPPAEFIPQAEDNGLILPLGHWVLETACSQLVIWAMQADMAHLAVAVNVSSRQFRQKDFVEQVLAVLRVTGANPRRLKLELTESLLLHDMDDIVAKMTALKAEGVSFSLDDFGTGYSSLSYLKRLPLGQLKIDQSFVRDILTDSNDAAIARTIIALGQSLGLAVIAEGVETEEQRVFLASHGCHAYQGYLFGRPGLAAVLLGTKPAVF